MPESYAFDSIDEQRRIDEAAAVLSTRLANGAGGVPEVLVVAGSGLGGFAARVQGALTIPYEAVPHFPQSTVAGHAGKLVAGTVAGHRVVVMSGRKHLYEGVETRVTVRAMRALIRAGVKTVILSNAAGGMNRLFKPGDLMLINDHINAQWRFALAGPNLDQMGERFPDMSAPYDRGLLAKARAAALRIGLKLHEGVYLALSGPTYETPAEVLAYRFMADAVGMSTVAETTAAVHAGARVLGVSAITNSHVLKTGVVTSHEEVMEVGRAVGEAFGNLVEAVIGDL